MTATLFWIATILATLLGFFLGVRSKAVAKRKAIDKERRQVERLSTITHRNAPPPPPPPRVIREGIIPAPPKAPKEETNYNYLSPGILYKKRTFVNTNICKSCNTIALYSDMWEHRPCPSCGGKVKKHKPCKWQGGKWIETTAK